MIAYRSHGRRHFGPSGVEPERHADFRLDARDATRQRSLAMPAVGFCRATRRRRALREITKAMNWKAIGSISGDIRDSPNQAFASAGNAGSRPVRVLLIEDDQSMRQMVVNYLEQHNMRLVSASNRQETTRQFAAGEPNLVILDLRLGQEDGLDLLREIRSRSDVPVIIITGHRRDEIDRVVGLELGADDYLTKPFGLRELLARIRAVPRRRESGLKASQRDGEVGCCRFGGWQLDRRSRRLTDPKGGPVTLTKGEYALLIAFLDAPQRPLSREYLLQATRVHEDVFDRGIDVRIPRLRRKLGTDPGEPRVIQTGRGVGYVFTLPVATL
jgi:two-component system OmpR family response regulator